MDSVKRTLLILVVMSLMVVVAGTARADWNPGDPYKMLNPQLPDMEPTGMDVLATWPYQVSTAPIGKILADDWMCTESGPVADIHIWGSWLSDILPQDATGAADPGAVGFKLSIHEDIPAVPGATYSQPGTELWKTFVQPGDPNWTARLYGQASEQFYDPNLNEIIGSDTQVWQYNFYFDPAEAFVQKEGTVYWLDVMAMLPTDSQAVWGWKTSLDHWNDDAVWGDVFGDPGLDPDVWNELRYPIGHPLEGQSIDLAFVITPEPATMIILALGLVPAVLHRRKKA